MPTEQLVKVFNINSFKIYEAVNITDDHVHLRSETGHVIKVRHARAERLYREYSEEAYEEAKAARAARGNQPTTTAPRRTLSARQKKSINIGVVETPDPERYNWDSMVLQDTVFRDIQIGLSRVVNREAVESVWQLSRLDPTSKSALNFYGSAGTGKTHAARCVAAQLNKPLLVVDYASMVQCLSGSTGRAVRNAFKTAEENDAVLFFDEADSMVSKRHQAGAFNPTLAQEQNTTRNILMQELDRYSGVVIFATNLFSNFDEAMLRRVAMHVEFKKPDKAMRKTLFEKHITRHDLLEPDVDFDELAEASKGLAGGDILQIAINAINTACLTGSPETWKLNRNHLMSQVMAVLRTKMMHGHVPEPVEPNITTIED